MRKTTILGILLLLAVFAMPMASAANVTLYLNPQHSSVPGYCNNTTVDVWLNIPAGMQVSYGQFGIDYDPTCGNIVDRNFNTDIMTGVDPSWSFWNSPPLQNDCWDDDTDWIVFKFWIPKSGPTQVLIGNFTIHGNSTGYCTSDLNFTCKSGCSQGCITMWDGSGEVPVNATDGTFTCGTPSVEPDLNVTDIYLNPGDTRANETLRVYVNQSNDVCAVVHNNGPGDVTDDFDVCFEVDGTKICCVTVDVSTLPGGVLAAGASTWVCCDDWTPSCIDYPVMSGYPSQSLPFTINVTADCNCEPGCCPNCPDDGSCGRIDETDETNNGLSMPVPAIQPWAGIDRIGGVVNNAYKSRHCDCDTSDDPLSDYWVEYRDLTCGGIEWDVTSPDITLNNGSTDTRVQTIDLPSDASSVKKAMLFVYWRDYWTNTNTYPSGCLADLSANMSSVCGTSPAVMPVEAAYHDTKGFGKYNSPMGVNIYNVTAWTCTNGGNPVDYTVNVTNIDPANKTKLMGLMLVVIYECDGDSLTHIWVHEGVDYLMAADATHGSYAYHVSPEEATATIPFSGTDTIPDNICEATLTTVVGNGMANGAYALFNGGTVLELNNPDVIAVDEVDVTSNFAVGSTNSMGFMDDTSNGFYAFNVFLVVTEKQSVPTATGLGDASFCVDKGCIENLTALNKGDVPGLPGNALFPYGLFSFNVTCLEPGATVNVTIELPPGTPTPTYMKYNNTPGSGGWDDKVPYNSSTGVLTLQDGGPYDRDGLANGVISDPGGPLSGAVQVGIDPCPAYVYPGGNVTVNITLSGITDYGSGTITLCAEPCNGGSAYALIESVGLGDSSQVTHSPLGGSCVEISASNANGLSGGVRFATVTLEPMGNPGDCICLNLTVDSLYDRNYTALQTAVDDCMCPSGGLRIIEDDPPFIVSAIADPPLIYNLSCSCPTCTNLTVHVTDATGVAGVWVDLTPILGAGCDMVRMTGPDGAKDGDWYWETCANYSRPLNPYLLDVMANDTLGNWNNGSDITLEVRRTGDVNLDNLVDAADYGIIAQYTVGLKPQPDPCPGDIVPPPNPDGIIDMGDALYIAMYATWNPIPGYPAPGSLCPCPCPCPPCP